MTNVYFILNTSFVSTKRYTDKEGFSFFFYRVKKHKVSLRKRPVTTFDCLRWSFYFLKINKTWMRTLFRRHSFINSLKVSDDSDNLQRLHQPCSFFLKVMTPVIFFYHFPIFTFPTVFLRGEFLPFTYYLEHLIKG